MQIAFHVGVHATDGDRMLKTLLNNRTWLLENRTEVVPPRHHRGLFEEALMSLNGGTSTPEMEQILLDAILQHEGTQRVIFSSQTFMGAPGRAVGRDGFYPQIGSQVAALANLFPSAQTEFFLAIRNPATLLTDVLKQFTGGGYKVLMQGQHPRDLRWRDAIQRLLRHAQGRRVVIWCHEDVPLIWPEVVRLVARMPPDAPLMGALIYMQEILGDEGLARLRGALGERDQLTVAQRREIYARTIREHALPGVLDQVVDLPDWTQELVDEVTENYRADVAQIACLPGVEFILP